MKAADILDGVIDGYGDYIPGGIRVWIKDESKSDDVIYVLKNTYRDASKKYCDDFLKNLNNGLNNSSITLPFAACDADESDDTYPFSEIDANGNTITILFSSNTFESSDEYDVTEYGNYVANQLINVLKNNNAIMKFEGFIAWNLLGGDQEEYFYTEISSTRENYFALELVNAENSIVQEPVEDYFSEYTDDYPDELNYIKEIVSKYPMEFIVAYLEENSDYITPSHLSENEAAFRLIDSFLNDFGIALLNTGKWYMGDLEQFKKAVIKELDTKLKSFKRD